MVVLLPAHEGSFHRPHRPYSIFLSRSELLDLLELVGGEGDLS